MSLLNLSLLFAHLLSVYRILEGAHCLLAFFLFQVWLNSALSVFCVDLFRMEVDGSCTLDVMAATVVPVGVSERCIFLINSGWSSRLFPDISVLWGIH